MYNNSHRNEECFIIIKRPCGCMSNNNFPNEIRFADNDNFYGDGFGKDNGRDFDEKFFDRKPIKNPCRCHCHDREDNRPRRRCCFNFFHWC